MITIKCGRLVANVRHYRYKVDIDGFTHTIMVERKTGDVFDFFRQGENIDRAIDWDEWLDVMEMIKQDILKQQ